MSKTFKIEGNDISDGYHTFDELYEHRCLLFVNLCLLKAKECAWKYDEGIADWFILYWESPRGQISYHIPLKHLSAVKEMIAQGQGHIWDGHTSKQVLERLTP